jgi:putative two-component system response regulator
MNEATKPDWAQSNSAPVRQTILAVDDQSENLEVLRAILHRDYKVVAARGGGQALKVASSGAPPDLILLDIDMVDMTGYELCRQLKSIESLKRIPVIFVTSLGEELDEALGFEVGGVDYITKPVSPRIVLARIKAQLALANQSRELERRVLERTAELAQAQDIAIYSLSILAEFRDNDTGAHILRTQEYVRLLVEGLSSRPDRPAELDPKTATLLYKSAPLHDIGKVGIPDSILLKPDKLSAAEFEIMKSHARLGNEVIMGAEKALGVEADLSFLKQARDITISHHEKWDGSGYPRGLSGRNIPLSGRIMAIADVYDALSSKRVYKPALPHEKVMEIMLQGKARHFDPTIFEAFTSVLGRFRKVAETINGPVDPA